MNITYRGTTNKTSHARKMIRFTLTLALISLSSCEKRNETTSEAISSTTSTERLITSKDIDELPDKLTIHQLFEKFGQVAPTDPPMFIYPSITPDHVYIAFVDQDDEAAVSHECYDGIQIIRIIHTDYDLRGGSNVWDTDPKAAHPPPNPDPFEEDP